MQILDGKVSRNELNENSRGGTEAMVEGLLERVDPQLLDGLQIVVSRLREPLRDDKVRIFWCHDLPGDNESTDVLGEKDSSGKPIGWKKFDKLVFVSHWQKQQYINFYGIDHGRCLVMQNAIIPSKLEDIVKPDPKEEIRVIYHTTPHRGLDIAYAAVNSLVGMHPELKFHVYSSYDIYGWEERNKQYQDLFDAIENHPNMEYYGTVSNDEVRKAVNESHIFGYPSVWPETSCLSLMEAMSGKCVCLHSDLAALPETAANWTYMYGVHEERRRHADLFSSCLDQACHMIKDVPADLPTRLAGMKSYADLFYNWELRKVQWEQFLLSAQEVEPKPVQVPESYEADEFVYRTG